MKNENYILICIAILLLAYFLFSGVILEGVNEYTKGTQGTTCDKGRQIDSKANCEDAIKSLGLEAKEWYNDYSEKSYHQPFLILYPGTYYLPHIAFVHLPRRSQNLLLFVKIHMKIKSKKIEMKLMSWQEASLKQK